MKEIELAGLDGADPLGFLAAVGLLRVVSRATRSARMDWIRRGTWLGRLYVEEAFDPVDVVVREIERWRTGHSAVRFAEDAAGRMSSLDRSSREYRELVKVQDLKHLPAAFRVLMRRLGRDADAAAFLAAYATGVAVDGSGQTKPTSLHFTAGQQRFMDSVLQLLGAVTREDVIEALHGPWTGRLGCKDLRWRAGSERLRALLSFDPGPEKPNVVVGANWLAFQALPLLPVVPQGTRAVTTCFSGRGKRESFAWPVWSVPLSVDAARTLLATPQLDGKGPEWRLARGVAEVFRSAVVRSPQGYGNFGAAEPT